MGKVSVFYSKLLSNVYMYKMWKPCLDLIWWPTLVADLIESRC